MNGSIVLKLGGQKEILLRSVVSSDCDRLRDWKNAQREFFFFKDEISEEMQTRWMSSYLGRPDDYMFVVEQNGRSVGCLGLRFEDGRGDIYNVILGDPSLRGDGVMSLALRAVLTFGRKVSVDIGLTVLKSNPAVFFYAKNGFERVTESGDHYEMRVNWLNFQPIDFE